MESSAYTYYGVMVLHAVAGREARPTGHVKDWLRLFLDFLGNFLCGFVAEIAD